MCSTFTNILHSNDVRNEMLLRGKSVRSWCNWLLDRSFMVYSLSYFSFQPVLHNWCNKHCGRLIKKSSPCGGSGFPLLLSKWSFTVCPTTYNRE